MRSVCVFCGSRPGERAAYREAAESLAVSLVRSGLSLVYGGARVGLMGFIADAVLEAGGEVVGVIPDALQRREIAHTGLTELIVVPDMHARKARMASLADAFITLPGGLGTYEELFEIATWAQLGMHNKPIGVLNVEHYFDPLIRLLRTCIDEGFVPASHRELFVIEHDPNALVPRLKHHHSPSVRKWLGPSDT